ncbi:GNAT family N-acetyltransferase [Halobellus captivus]|uniref:GNAT family N-acetyltransferase n=1 Tax=Halobellus captivus TaxID=2592614 RepID=UPI0011A8DD9D|nr:GNAT family N-acetyltransferase [Halobellus captivus]
MPEDATDDVRLRPAHPDDAAAVRDIYAPFVRDTPVTFRTEVPTVEHIADEIRQNREDDAYPWYVAVAEAGDNTNASDENGTNASDDDSTSASNVVGYAYGTQLRGRRAYRWAVETSVYVDSDAHRGGIGTALYDRLLDTLRRQGYCGAYAALGMPNPESEAFHERRGFERVGTFPAAGFKLGDWHDVVWYHRRLREPEGEPEEPRPVSAVDPDFAASGFES